MISVCSPKLRYMTLPDSEFRYNLHTLRIAALYLSVSLFFLSLYISYLVFAVLKGISEVNNWSPVI